MVLQNRGGKTSVVTIVGVGKKKAKLRRGKGGGDDTIAMTPSSSSTASAVFLAALLALAAAAVPHALAASANAPYPEDPAKQLLFVKYEQMAWHYAYQESETQNLESFGKWWCQDSADDSCILVDNPSFVFMMRYFEQHRDSVIWNLTQQVPQAQQILPKHIKYLVSKDYADAASVEETFAAPWQSFVAWDQLAFHFDYAKTEEQNLQAFQAWLCEEPTGSQRDAACNPAGGSSGNDSSTSQLASMMWFYEQHRDDILAAKAVKQYGSQADRPEIEGWISVDYQCTVENDANACDTMMAATTTAKDGNQ